MKAFAIDRFLGADRPLLGVIWLPNVPARL